MHMSKAEHIQARAESSNQKRLEKWSDYWGGQVSEPPSLTHKTTKVLGAEQPTTPESNSTSI